MAVSITCVHCGAAIKSSKPIPAGKKVKCPKCAQSFVVAGESGADKAAPASSPAPADDNPFASMGPGDPDKVELPPPPKSNPLPAILVICGALLVLSCCCCVGVGGYAFRANLKSLLEFKKEDKKPATKTGADFAPPAREFADEVTQNREAASQKYLGKSVEITGDISRIDRVGKDQKPGVVMDVDGIWVMEFALKPASQAKAIRLSNGQKVTITATFQGVRDKRLLTFDAGTLTETAPSKFTEIGSEKLVTEFLNDEPGATMKFRGVLLVSGPIVEYHRPNPEEIVVIMKGSGKTMLWLTFDRERWKEAGRLEKAKTATIRATTTPELDRVDQRLVIHDALIIESK